MAKSRRSSKRASRSLPFAPPFCVLRSIPGPPCVVGWRRYVWRGLGSEGPLAQHRGPAFLRGLSGCAATTEHPDFCGVWRAVRPPQGTLVSVGSGGLCGHHSAPRFLRGLAGCARILTLRFCGVWRAVQASSPCVSVGRVSAFNPRREIAH